MEELLGVRQERHLMRQRGAGARAIQGNFGFVFKAGPVPIGAPATTTAVEAVVELSVPAKNTGSETSSDFSLAKTVGTTEDNISQRPVEQSVAIAAGIELNSEEPNPPKPTRKAPKKRKALFTKKKPASSRSVKTTLPRAEEVAESGLDKKVKNIKPRAQVETNDDDDGLSFDAQPSQRITKKPVAMAKGGYPDKQALVVEEELPFTFKRRKLNTNVVALETSKSAPSLNGEALTMVEEAWPQTKKRIAESRKHPNTAAAAAVADTAVEVPVQIEQAEAVPVTRKRAAKTKKQVAAPIEAQRPQEVGKRKRAVQPETSAKPRRITHESSHGQYTAERVLGDASVARQQIHTPERDITHTPSPINNVHLEGNTGENETEKTMTPMKKPTRARRGKKTAVAVPESPGTKIEEAHASTTEVALKPRRGRKIAEEATVVEATGIISTGAATNPRRGRGAVKAVSELQKDSQTDENIAAAQKSNARSRQGKHVGQVEAVQEDEGTVAPALPGEAQPADSRRSKKCVEDAAIAEVNPGPVSQIRAAKLHRVAKANEEVHAAEFPPANSLVQLASNRWKSAAFIVHEPEPEPDQPKRNVERNRKPLAKQDANSSSPRKGTAVETDDTVYEQPAKPKRAAVRKPAPKTSRNTSRPSKAMTSPNLEPPLRHRASQNPIKTTKHPLSQPQSSAVDSDIDADLFAPMTTMTAFSTAPKVNIPTNARKPAKKTNNTVLKRAPSRIIPKHKDEDEDVDLSEVFDGIAALATKAGAKRSVCLSS